ncbi:hypothetical protein HK101_005136, partial [Irineochytrium annulatum]
MRNWPYAIGVTKSSNVDWAWDVAPLPGQTNATRGATTLGGWHLGANAATQNPAATAAVAKFLSSAVVQKARYLDVGVLPTISALYQDNDVCTKLQHCDLFGQLLVNPRPSAQTSPHYLDVSTVVYTTVSSFLGSQISLPDLLSSVEINSMKAMGTYGSYVLSLATFVSVQSAVGIIFMAISGLGILFGLLSAVLVFINRNDKGIKAASPDFLYI